MQPPIDRNTTRRRLLGWGAVVLATRRGEAKETVLPGAGDVEVLQVLRGLPAARRLPALGAAVLQPDGSTRVGVVGFRQSGDPTPVKVGDLFHLGSCTKAMTATLLARQVEAGELSWDTTVAQAFPEWKDDLAPAIRGVTLLQLLANRGGISGETAPPDKTLLDVHRLPGDAAEQRRAYARQVLQRPLAAAPGSRYIYSNAGYVVAAHMGERAARLPYEELLRRRILQPLGMHSAGYGPMGRPGSPDQPRQHQIRGTRLEPVQPTSLADNPPAITPAGRVHASLADWARFVRAHVGGPGAVRLVSEATLKRLHTPLPGADYALGWIAVERDWGGGRVLTHAGSNTMNYALAWAAPARRFAVLVVTNAGGGDEEAWCDEAAGTLIRRFAPTPPGKQE